MDGIGRSFFSQLAQLELEVASGQRGQALADRVENAYQTVLANEYAYNEGDLLARVIHLKEQLGNNQETVSVALIRDTFYNLMASCALRMDHVDEHSLVAITGLAVIEAIEQSRAVRGILCYTGQEVTSANCPELFASLIEKVLAYKKEITSLDEQELVALKALLCNLAHHNHNPKLKDLSQKLQFFATVVQMRPEFQEMSHQLLAFVRGTKQPRHTLPIDPKQLAGVTEDLVRDSFYELMAEHAALSGLITKDALESQESYVFFALSYHALIEAMLQSKLYEGPAIALKNKKVLTEANCPELYKPLAEVIFKYKSHVCNLNPEQIDLLKTYDHPEKEAALEKGELTVAGELWIVAQKISELHTFKQIILRVFDFILGAK